jgi:hypothetical protein
VQITSSQAAAVTPADACRSVYRLDNSRVSTKFVIAGDMANVDFDRKGTQSCDGDDMKVYVSVNTYDSMKCNKGNAGWSASWNNFRAEHICICSSGSDGNVVYHLASTDECDRLRHLRNI